MHSIKPTEVTYDTQQQKCGKKFQYWGDLEDDVNISLELAGMSIVNEILDESNM